MRPSGRRRRTGHRIVDEAIARHRSLREAPCWQPVPEGVKRGLNQAAPVRGLGLEAALAKAAELIQPHGTGNLHPRFWGWVLGAGNLPGILGQWMAAGMNANVFGGDQVPVHLELQVLDCSGLGSASRQAARNPGRRRVDGEHPGLAIARHRATDGRCKADGPEACVGLRVYASEATHNSITKGAELLGLGQIAVRLVPTDSAGRIDLQALQAAIEADSRRALRPFCIVAARAPWASVPWTADGASGDR